MQQTDLLHHVPGRLRIRSRTLCGFAKSRNPVVRKLRALEGIRECHLNMKAGCVTVFYDAEIVSVDAILKLLKEHNIIDSKPLTRRVKKPVKSSKLTSMIGKTALNMLINRGVSYSISSLLGARI